MCCTNIHLIIDQFIAVTITAHYSAFSMFHFNHPSHNFMHSGNYVNCNIFENLINKVLDVKPLVPFIITEICQ